MDLEGDPIEYRWTGTGGSFADPDAPETTFTCQQVGEQTITITVSDDGFRYCDWSWTVRVTCVDGGGGTGGVAGRGGVGGTGGVGGVGGTGGNPQACGEGESIDGRFATNTGLVSCDALGVITIPFEVTLAAIPTDGINAGAPSDFEVRVRFVLDEDIVADFGALLQTALIDESSADVNDDQGGTSVNVPAMVPCTVDFTADPDENGTAGPIVVTTAVQTGAWSEADGSITLQATTSCCRKARFSRASSRCDLRLDRAVASIAYGKSIIGVGELDPERRNFND